MRSGFSAPCNDRHALHGLFPVHSGQGSFDHDHPHHLGRRVGRHHRAFGERRVRRQPAGRQFGRRRRREGHRPLLRRQQLEGTADCKTTANECKGQNECKGHGFKALAAGQCLTKGGTIGDLR